ncbi:MAG: hypothetical protein WBN77_16150, partial [Desulfobacterales bacterium]
SDGGAIWKCITKREADILDIGSMGKTRPTLYSLDFQDDKTGVECEMLSRSMSTLKLSLARLTISERCSDKKC